MDRCSDGDCMSSDEEDDCLGMSGEGSVTLIDSGVRLMGDFNEQDPTIKIWIEEVD